MSSLTRIIGIVLVVLGLGTGVWEWLTGGVLNIKFPTGGLILLLIGLYFALKSEKKRSLPIGTKEVLKYGGAAAIGATVATLLSQLSKPRASTTKIPTQAEIDELLDKVRDAYAIGELSKQEYEEFTEKLKRARSQAS